MDGVQGQRRFFLSFIIVNLPSFAFNFRSFLCHLSYHSSLCSATVFVHLFHSIPFLRQTHSISSSTEHLSFFIRSFLLFPSFVNFISFLFSSSASLHTLCWSVCLHDSPCPFSFFFPFARSKNVSQGLCRFFPPNKAGVGPLHPELSHSLFHLPIHCIKSCL